MQIVFLIYDSRSGSTFLSNLIMKYIEGVVVTPEIGFKGLLKKKKLSNMKTYQIFKENYLKNIQLSNEEIVSILRDAKNRKDVIYGILQDFIKKNYTKYPLACVVKYGQHAFLWKEIVEIFGKDTRFIFLYRDPRAVVNSKLKTTRPYYPFEKFAWGGSLLAAMRWYQYVKEVEKMKNNGMQVPEIRYEDLIKHTNIEVQKIADFLNLHLKKYL